MWLILLEKNFRGLRAISISFWQVLVDVLMICLYENEAKISQGKKVASFGGTL